MNFVDELRQRAAGHRSRAAEIRAAAATATASEAGVEVQVGADGRVRQVTFAAESSELSEVRLSETFSRVHQQACRAVEERHRSALPADVAMGRADHQQLIDDQHRPVTVEVTAESLAPPELPTAESYRQGDRQSVATGQVQWPAGVSDGPIDDVLAQLRTRLQQLADRSTQLGARAHQVAVEAEFPAGRPTVRVEVGGGGELRRATFAAAARVRGRDDLAADVMAACAQAAAEAQLKLEHLVLGGS